MTNGVEPGLIQPFMDFPGIWELGRSGPEHVKDFLTWVLDDPVLFKMASERLRYLKLGMHFLTIAQNFGPGGAVNDKLELNFWDPGHPPEIGAGGHSHQRQPMELWSFIHPDDRQQVTGISLLPPNAKRITGLPVQERRLTMLSKVDHGDGLGSFYNPLVLGPRLVVEGVTDMPPGTHQLFTSLFTHEVSFKGNHTGVTVQRQGALEPFKLSNFNNLQAYKGLTAAEADAVVGHRRSLSGSLVAAQGSLGASTVLIRDLDFEIGMMEDRAMPVPPNRFFELAEGSIRSLERFMRRN